MLRAHAINCQARLRFDRTRAIPALFNHLLRLSYLLDSQFTTIVSACRAYSVVDVHCAAVRANCQCRCFYYIMGTTLRLAGV